MLAFLSGLAFLVAACGDSPRSASASSPTTTSATSGIAGRAKLVACLEAHGVPASIADAALGGLGLGRTGTSTSTTTSAAGSQYASAFQACRPYLPSRLGSGGFRDSAAAKAFLDCLEQHGVTLPTTPPTSTSGGSSQGGLSGLAGSPNFKSAQAACAGLRPSFGEPSTTTSTTG